MFSPESESQAAAFDAIGEQYDVAFANKSAQVAAGQWLLGRLPPGARVLDVGCGSGLPTAKALAEAGHDVLGIDISGEMLRLARRNVPGARFERMDLAQLALPEGHFHAVTAFFSLLMLRKAAVGPTLERLARLLQPGGYLLVSMVEGDVDFVAVPFLGQQLRVTAFPRAELEALLRAQGLAVLDVEAVDFPPPVPGAPTERQLFFRCQVPAARG